MSIEIGVLHPFSASKTSSRVGMQASTGRLPGTWLAQLAKWAEHMLTRERQHEHSHDRSLVVLVGVLLLGAAVLGREAPKRPFGPPPSGVSADCDG